MFPVPATCIKHRRVIVELLNRVIRIDKLMMYVLFGLYCDHKALTARRAEPPRTVPTRRQRRRPAVVVHRRL